MSKYYIGEYVVYKGIVCKVRTVWHEIKKYGLERVYPHDPFWVDKIDESLLSKWNGTVNNNN